MRELIARGLEELGLAGRVPGDAPDLLAEYGGLMLEKNRVMNLTAIRDEAGVARLHMLDSAALVDCLPAGSRTLLDVGTGAGLPGLALKVLCPELEVTLLDSLNKRVDWLNEVCARLGLTGVRAVHARAEEQALQKGWRDSFDVVTARAVAELRLLCELCLPFVKVGGVFLAMKGVDSAGELAAAEHCIRLLGGRTEPPVDYAVPGAGVTHRVIPIRKVAPTLKGYPRRWARIQKEPL